ncbi:MAG: glycosyl transferase family 2 [Micrococcales bacterium]|nr:MAG: glycosyl transferase family 2 [Micrococcales bacterium]PIE27829.1 MAG: glycosyl transferase family 2 [Micrococcales bacterium]
MPGSGSGSAGGIVSVDPRTPQSTLVAGGGAPRAKADEGDSFIHDPRPKVKVSIVLPCYNEQDHVLAEVQRITESMDTSGFSYEILAIDDKSTDNTLQVLTDAKPQYPHMYVVPFPRNGGSGTARRIGSAIARGDIVVWTDADMSYPNERIPEFVTYLDENPACDQVVGARTTEEGTHKLLRVPAKLVIRKFAESLSSTKIPDLNSGLRAFRRDVSLPYLRLLPPGFSCVTTLTLSFLSNQHQVDYLPIKYSSRAGSSKFHPLRDAYRYIMQVLRMTMYFNPMKVLMPLALTLLAFGVVKSGYDVISDPFALSMNAILIVLSGLIIGSMALLADLIVRSRND